MSSYIIKNAKILDGKLTDEGKMPVQENMAVVVENNIIKEICKTSDLNIDGKKYETVYDLNGSYLMPGLINNHVHLAGKGGPAKPKKKPTNYKLLFNVLTKVPGCKQVYIGLEKKRALNQLLSGCTTIRSVGGILDFDGIVRDLVNSKKCVGPRILTSNTAVSVTGGHFAGSLACEANTPQEAIQWVDKIAASNPDFIKVMITGGVMDAVKVGEPGILKMSPEIVKATVDRAHELGFKAIAHVECSEGVDVALENGIDSIEHGATLSQQSIQKLKETGAVVTATVSPAVPYALFDESVSHCGEVARINGQALLDTMVECYKQCIDNNIKLGLGTDTGCPFITHYNFWRELHYLKTYTGASPDFVLHVATLGNAENIEIDNQTGSIEVGKNAEMIVSKNNPLDDFKNLEQLEYVFNNETIIKNPKPKKDTQTEIELDKFM